jgi:pyridoxamine 5'-phosphate oxidase family protein
MGRKDEVSRFTPKEIEYLQSHRLGRMATIGANGDPHVVPLSYRYNPEHDTIDLGGHNLVSTKKYRDALRYGRVAFVVDDVLPPWRPRLVEVRGTVQAFAEGGTAINQNFAPAILRLTPTYIVSMGVNDDVVHPGEDTVNYYGRKVT